jgi:hypothetical protein
VWRWLRVEALRSGVLPGAIAFSVSIASRAMPSATLASNGPP